jgi:hypothetical protein
VTRAKEKEKVDVPQFDGSLDCNGALVVDALTEDPRQGYVRIITYYFAGEEYSYGMEAIGASTPEVAKAKLSGPRPLVDTQQAFLRDVSLNQRRPH